MCKDGQPSIIFLCSVGSNASTSGITCLALHKNFAREGVVRFGIEEIDCRCRDHSHVLLFLMPPMLAHVFCCLLGPFFVNPDLDSADKVYDLVDKRYHLDTFRKMYDDERFEVQLPVPEELTRDVTMLPPRQVEGKAGRPRGSKKTKRFASRGDKSASSAFNVRLEPSSGTTPSTTALSQGAPALSQGPPSLSQGTPALSQGGAGAQAGVISIAD